MLQRRICSPVETEEVGKAKAATGIHAICAGVQSLPVSGHIGMRLHRIVTARRSRSRAPKLGSYSPSWIRSIEINSCHRQPSAQADLKPSLNPAVSSRQPFPKTYLYMSLSILYFTNLQSAVRPAGSPILRPGAMVGNQAVLHLGLPASSVCDY